MSISLHGESNQELTTSSTTITPSSGIATTTGDLIVVFVCWEGGTTTVTITDSAGNTGWSSPDGVQETTGASKKYCQVFYKLAATGHANNVITATFGVARTYRGIQAHVFTPTATLYFVALEHAFSTSSASVGPTTGFNATHPAVVVGGETTYNQDSTPVSISGSSGGSYTMSSTSSGRIDGGYLLTSGNLSSEAVTFTGTLSTSAGRVLSVVAFSETDPAASAGGHLSTISFM